MQKKLSKKRPAPAYQPRQQPLPTLRSVAGAELVELLSQQGITTLAALASNQTAGLAMILAASAEVDEREVVHMIAKVSE